MVVFFLPQLVAAYLIGSTIHGKQIHERDLIAPRSSDFDNDKVSATINDALAKAGFDADEADSFLAGYHVAVDQFDDNEEESRKLLADVLLKVLDYDDVETVGGALDVLGDKADRLIPRDFDTTTGSNDGMNTDHVIVTDSSNDLAARDVPMFFKIMATMISTKGYSDKDPIIDMIEDGHDEHGSEHDKRSSQSEELQQAADHAGPKPVESVKKSNASELPEPVDEEHVRPMPVEVLASHPLLAQLIDMAPLDNLDAPRAVTSEDIGRILVLFFNPNSTKIPGLNSNLTDSDYAKLNFLERLKEMGLLQEPKEKRVMVSKKFLKLLQNRWPKVNTDRNTTLPSATDDSAEAQQRTPVPDHLFSHSKRSVPEFPGCDCQATIDAVKDPKPEGGMTYTWFQDWKHKDMNPKCIRTCVDKAIDHFDETVRRYQAFEAQFGPDVRQRPKDTPGLSKREQPVDPSKPAEAEVQTVKNEPPKSAYGMTYRDWFEKTHETGEFCTCHVQSPSILSWLLSFYRKSPRCIEFCAQSVKPFLEKEKEALHVPQEPVANATAIKEPVGSTSPSGEKVPGAVSVPTPTDHRV